MVFVGEKMNNKNTKKKGGWYSSGFLVSIISLIVFSMMLIFIPQNDVVWYFRLLNVISEYGTGFSGTFTLGFIISTLLSPKLKRKFSRMMGGF